MEEYKYSQKKVNQILQTEIDNISKTSNVKDMLEYAISGGKRIRPVIALTVSEYLCISKDKNYYEKISTIITFLEFLHSASLILDDLPCMDNDELRRGHPTFHKMYGQKMSYVIANFMIGKSCSKVVKLVNKLENISEFVITQIFDNNFLTSLGQIKDLDKDDSRESYFMNKITDKVMKNEHIQKLITKVDLSFNQFEKVFWLNMKTFPLFYLSFLLPYLIIDNSNENSEAKTSTINIIEYISLCFSIMFQISDDLEDWEKDSSLDKVNSHLKIIPKEQVIPLYYVCRDSFIQGLNIFNKEMSSNKVFHFFVEILDKKIDVYLNGTN